MAPKLTAEQILGKVKHRLARKIFDFSIWKIIKILLFHSGLVFREKNKLDTKKYCSLANSALGKPVSIRLEYVTQCYE